MTTLYTHPVYNAQRENWIRYRDLYEGDHNVLAGSDYLWLHPIETKNDPDGATTRLRAGREQRTRYLNLVEAVTSLWCSFFFREDYTLDDATRELLGDAEDDIDGKGTSLLGFIKDQITVNYLLYGRVYVTADAFSRTGRNLAEQKNLNVRPFLEIHHPLTVKDWDIETEDTRRIGKYNFIRYEYDLIPPRTPSQEPIYQRYSQVLDRNGNKYRSTTYKTPIDSQGNYTRLDPTSKNAEWEPVSTIDSQTLEEIPLAVISQSPWLHDVCEETLRFYNLRSNLDNVNYFQGYDDKYIIGVTNPEQMKNFGEYIVKFLPQEGSATKLEPSNPVSLERSVDGALSNVFKVGLNMFRTLPSDSKGVQSADTQQEDKDNTYAMVESSLDDIEALVNQSLTHWATFQGKKGFIPGLELCKEVKQEDFDMFIKVVNAFRDEINQQPIVQEGVFEKVIEKLDLPTEKRDEALAALKATPLKSSEQILKEQQATMINGALGG